MSSACVKGVKVEHGGKARDARQDELGAATKTHVAVGIDAANAELEICVCDNFVDVNGQAAVQAAQCAEVAAHEVVVRDSIGAGDISPHFFVDFFRVDWAVRSPTYDNADLIFGYACCVEFFEDIGDEFGSGCGTAQVIYDDCSTVFSFGEF